MKHKSVLLEEVIKYLDVKTGGKYIDATVGYGGHSSEILKKIGKEGVLFAFDQDDNAIEFSNSRLSEIGSNFTIFKKNYKLILEVTNDEDTKGLFYDCFGNCNNSYINIYRI